MRDGRELLEIALLHGDVVGTEGLATLQQLVGDPVDTADQHIRMICESVDADTQSGGDLVQCGVRIFGDLDEEG